VAGVHGGPLVPRQRVRCAPPGHLLAQQRPLTVHSRLSAAIQAGAFVVKILKHTRSLCGRDARESFVEACACL